MILSATQHNMEKIRQKIRKWLLDDKEQAFKDGVEKYLPKLWGEGKVVAFTCRGLVDSYVEVSTWPSGEGYDLKINFKNGSGYDEKHISLHEEELEAFFYCLEHLKHFQL